MTEKIYLFECGCVREGKKNYKKGGRICCPEHGGILVGVPTICSYCGKKYIKKSKGRHSNPCCIDCRQIRIRISNRKYRERGPVPKKKGLRGGNGEPILGKKQTARFEDCAYYNDCLTPPSGNLYKNQNACFKCEYFRQANPLDISDYVFCEDIFSEVTC